MFADLIYVIQWWFYLTVIGLIFVPVSTVIFSKLLDRGYFFSKILGIGTITYIVFIGGILHILPFNILSIYSALLIALIINIIVFRKFGIGKISSKRIYLVLFEELLFFLLIALWVYIKGFQPDIYGLEKYMDFGFINSILRSQYFPPQDMWFAPESINYYYFGHLVTALLTKLSNLPSYISYNLMLSTIFAFTALSAFSIVSTITFNVLSKRATAILAGILASITTSLGGNLHTVYTLFKPYSLPENPEPLWRLTFSPATFPNNYWYPNATRFIPFTIHEFPAYSFVVSDLHGHVLDIPFVFLTIASIYMLFARKKVDISMTIFIAFLLSIMYMTNAWDGIIYFGLFSLSVLILNLSIIKTKSGKRKTYLKFFKITISKVENKIGYILSSAKYIVLAAVSYFIFSLPFNLNFKPFVSGFGVLCPPEFLVKIGEIGPIIFEANHCQRSPLWMIITLYGFFLFFVISLCIKILKLKKVENSLYFVLALITISLLLILAPELVYAKDIYPAHYRANTMFKLGYQAFIMLSITSSFAIAYLLNKGRRLIWLPVILLLLSFILIYPYFAVDSYFDGLREYKGINGIKYLETLHPNDYKAISWINSNIANQPLILEAQGDSYSDYGRISANTGLGTVLGWTVHEWLWRGDYSYPQSRMDDVRALYEDDLEKTKSLIKKYGVSYVYVGDLERTKYPLLQENKFLQLGELIYQNEGVKIYKIN